MKENSTSKTERKWFGVYGDNARIMLVGTAVMVAIGLIVTFTIAFFYKMFGGGETGIDVIAGIWWTILGLIYLYILWTFALKEIPGILYKVLYIVMAGVIGYLSYVIISWLLNIFIFFLLIIVILIVFGLFSGAFGFKKRPTIKAKLENGKIIKLQKNGKGLHGEEYYKDDEGNTYLRSASDSDIFTRIKK